MDADSSLNTPTPPKRHWFRFSIRTMLVVTALFALLLLAHIRLLRKADHQKRLMTELLADGTYVRYEHAQDENGGPGTRTFPLWLERSLGVDYLYSIDAVLFTQPSKVADSIEKITQFPKLVFLRFPPNTITNEKLRPLIKLRQLELLDVHDNPISDEGIAILRDIKSLKTLDARGTRITDACLTDITALPKLTSLLIGNTAITGQGQAIIKKALPECDVNIKFH